MACTARSYSSSSAPHPSRGRRFAQHVVRERKPRASCSRLLSDRLGDRPAGDELFAHQAHGDVDARADHRLAAAGDQPRERQPTGLARCGRHQPAGQHQTPRRGVDEQRRAVAEMRLPVARARACRGSGRRAWRRRECAAAPRRGTSAPRPPGSNSEYSWISPSTPLERVFAFRRAARPRASASMRVASSGFAFRHREERRHTLGFRPAVGGGDRGPERRLRENLGAERGENVGVGHDGFRRRFLRSCSARSGGDRAIYYREGRFAYAAKSTRRRATLSRSRFPGQHPQHEGGADRRRGQDPCARSASPALAERPRRP